MIRFKKYSSKKIKDSYDVIIIGSGISGLCSGALLAQQGKKVLILEKHFKIGGFTHTFSRQNYEWDVGLHYVGSVHRTKSFARRLFDKISNKNLKWKKMSDNYDRIIFPDQSYDFIAPKEQFMKTMCSYFPNENEAIIKYVDLVSRVNKTMFKYFASKSLSGMTELLLYKYLTKSFFKYSDLTTHEGLSKITSNKKLIAVLSGQWGDFGLPPKQSSFLMHCAIAGHYFDGANYPIGGSRSISESIAPQILNNGGDIFMMAPVDKVLIKNDKCCGIVMENGDQIKSKSVISSTGVNNSLKYLLKDYKHHSDYSSNLRKIKPSSGHACLYVGFEQTAQELNIKDTNLWIYPSYDHDLNTSNYLRDESSEFPLVYISFASAKDPTWEDNHGNTATLEAIVPTNFNNYTKWQDKPWKNRGSDYIQFKQEFSNRIFEKIYKHVPQLKDKISFSELSTPLSTKSMSFYDNGELYGIDHTPQRFRQKWIKVKTPLRYFYMTGQDITTVGIPSALASGALTASVVLKKNLFKTI